MTDRPTASTITDQQLDDLHDRLARAEAAIARVRALHTQGKPWHRLQEDGTWKEVPLSEKSTCTYCWHPPSDWPCTTLAALDKPKEQ